MHRLLQERYLDQKYISKDKKRDEIFSLLKRNHKKVYIHEPRVVIKFLNWFVISVQRPSISRIGLLPP